MTRRKFSREFKMEAAKMVTERGELPAVVYLDQIETDQQGQRVA